MQKLLLTITFNLIFINVSISQTGVLLDGLFDKDKTFERGIYIVENNAKVGKNATLTIKAGSKIIFKRGASVKVDGGLILEGRQNGFIEIKSDNPESEGLGFIISQSNPEKEINISYCRFSYLLIPITFEKNWTRKVVKIENNNFEKIITGEPSIIFRNPDEITAKGEIKFSFSKNIFTQNNSLILFDFSESDVVDLSVEHNLITTNYYYGLETGGGYTAPLLINYDNKGMKFQAKISNNSIYDNYLLNNNETIVQETNFGIRGRGERFLLNNNYFGPKNSNEIQKTFDHFTNNQSAPFIQVDEPLLAPSDSAHGHIWKVYFNGNLILENEVPEIFDPALDVIISHNREFLLRDGVSYISYTYFDQNTQKPLTKNISSSMKIDKENKNIRFSLRDEVFTRNKNGYFTIGGMADNEGFVIPNYYIGKKKFKNYLSKNKIDAELD